MKKEGSKRFTWDMGAGTDIEEEDRVIKTNTKIKTSIKVNIKMKIRRKGKSRDMEDNLMILL